MPASPTTAPTTPAARCRTKAVLASAATLALACALSGCVPLAVGTAATGAAVAHDTRTTGTVLEDQTIELKASNALAADAELRAETHINITSYNLVVLISGEAPTEELRARVVDRVRRVDRVKLVHNEVAIAAPSSVTSRSSDTLITTKVKTALLGLENFDGTRVKVVTERGIVYLMGLLTREEGDRAANAVRGVGGVQKVVKLFEYSR